MAARRATNNSTVVSLEEQTEVIDNATALAGGISTKKTDSSKDSKKVGLKKPKVSSSRSAKAKTAGTQGTLDLPQGPQPTGDSQGPRQGGGTSDVTDSGSRAGAPRSVAATVTKETGLRGTGGHDPKVPTSTLAAPSTNAQANEGVAEELGELDEAFLAQQQWLWQQHVRQFGMQMPHLGQYANFMPNFQFGVLPQVPDWEEHGEEEVIAVEEIPVPQAKRQGTHEVSDEEEEGEGEEVFVVGEVPKSPVEEGITSGLVKQQLGQVKEADRVAKPVNENVASLLERYLKDCTAAGEMDKLAKKHPRIENIVNMKTPRLDQEVFQVIDQNLKNADQAYQGIQRGILGAMGAFIPVLELVFQRKTADPELDKLGEGVLEGLQLLAHANNAVGAKRRDYLKPHLAPTYAKTMSKGQAESPDWLYGGNLVETAKQCEAAKKIGEKVLKRKPQFPARGRGTFEGKRFRQPMQSAMMQLPVRPYQAFQWGNPRFPGPQTFASGYPTFPTPQVPNNMMGYAFPRRQRFFKPRQGFGKRGAHNNK